MPSTRHKNLKEWKRRRVFYQPSDQFKAHDDSLMNWAKQLSRLQKRAGAPKQFRMRARDLARMAELNRKLDGKTRQAA